MSSRQQLIRALNSVPENVAEQLLTYLHSLPGQQNEPTLKTGPGDFFTNYWSDLYGIGGEMEWNEPADLPFEKREEW